MRPVFRCLLIFICTSHFDALISLIASFLVATSIRPMNSTPSRWSVSYCASPATFATLSLLTVLRPPGSASSPAGFHR